MAALLFHQCSSCPAAPLSPSEPSLGAHARCSSAMVIRLSRMMVTRDMMATLGLAGHSDGIDQTPCGKKTTWISFVLRRKDSPADFLMTRVEARPYERKVDAEESLEQRFIKLIKSLTGYDVDDVNYGYANITQQ